VPVTDPDASNGYRFEVGAFLWVEGHSQAPMLSLTMFRSRTFSVINILTLLLYGALGGVLFFLPFALIQVRGYPATLAGATFLPFTIIMAGLSRWAGGLLDRFGARLPLVVGPAISALGIGLMASMVASGAYWEFLIPIVILGFGMVISVAPLTTTVINSVSANQTGIASGINNAVASVANLFAVAILGAVALGILNHTLDRYVQSAVLSPGVREAIQAAHGSFVVAPALSNIQGADRLAAETVIKGSLAESIQSVMLIATALAISAAAAGTLLPRSTAITNPNDS
jgi:MFS family permease